MEGRLCRVEAVPTLARTLLCTGLTVTVVSAAGSCNTARSGVGGAPQTFTAWSSPVNLGAPPNSPARDAGPFISEDGLRLYFGARGRTDSLGGFDLYVSRRAHVADPWGEPQNLGPAVNTSANDQAPALSTDESRLYFHSDRPGGAGGFDLYLSRRQDARDDSGWQSAVNLGSPVNSDADEQGPYVFEDGDTGIDTLFFSSNRPGGPGLDDIYASTLERDGSFGPPRVVPELSSPSRDLRPTFRRDGLEMFFDSDRPGGLGGLDIWVSTRPATSTPWSTPVNAGPVINTAGQDVRPALSADGTALYFHSGGRGGQGDFDLFVSMRTGVTGRQTVKK